MQSSNGSRRLCDKTSATGQPVHTTVHIPLTARNPVPSTFVLTLYPDGSGFAVAGRKLDKRRLHMAVFHHFGNRACWPVADGGFWRVKINPPATGAPAPEIAPAAEVETEAA